MADPRVQGPIGFWKSGSPLLLSRRFSPRSCGQLRLLLLLHPEQQGCAPPFLMYWVRAAGWHAWDPTQLSPLPGLCLQAWWGVGQDAEEFTTLERAGSHSRGAGLVPLLLALSLSGCPSVGKSL